MQFEMMLAPTVAHRTNPVAAGILACRRAGASSPAEKARQNLGRSTHCGGCSGRQDARCYEVSALQHAGKDAGALRFVGRDKPKLINSKMQISEFMSLGFAWRFKGSLLLQRSDAPWDHEPRGERGIHAASTSLGMRVMMRNECRTPSRWFMKRADLMASANFK